MSIATIHLANLTWAVRHLSLDEGTDRRSAFAPGWVTVMNCGGRRRCLRVGSYWIENVQTEKVVSRRLIFYVVRVFPKVGVNHFGITIAIYVSDGDAASGRQQARKEVRRKVGVASATGADPKRIRIRTIYVGAFKKPRPN